MFIPVRKRLGEMLLEEEIITESQLDTALVKQKETGERLGKVLVSLGFIDQMKLLKVLETKLGVPLIQLGRRRLDPDLAILVPEQLAQKYKIIPVEKHGERLTLAMADPLNVVAIDDVRITAGCDVIPAIALENEIDEAITRFYNNESIDKIIEDLPQSSDGDLDAGLDRMKEIVEDAPIVRLVNSLIIQAVNGRASDVHIEPREQELAVRFRIDGTLIDVKKFPKRMQAPVISRLKIMANLDIAERRIPQDGRVQMVIDNVDIDFRVSSLPTIFGEKIVLRILDKTRGLLSLEELGMLPEILKKFRAVIKQPYGIILVTGPTGSGKTTTLYSVLNEVNSSDKNIITIEDPVEYTLEGINQVQLNTKAGLTFASGLRSMLRQDPDIIMVGEIRDSETAGIAIRAAMTGHLVFSTVHTNTAASTLNRLVDMGIEPFMVASAVSGITAQRLLRRLCPECKEPYEPLEEVVRKYNLKSNAADKVVLFRPKGCPFCNNTGYYGRLAVHEVLFVTPRMKELVTQNVPSDKIESAAIEEGMLTLKEDGLRKVVLGLTSLEEVIRVIFAGLDENE